MTSETRNKPSPNPYRLRFLKTGLFQVHVHNGPAFEGIWETIFIAAQELGMHAGDLEMAREDLVENGYDYAEFGIFGRYLYPVRDSGRNAA